MKLLRKVFVFAVVFFVFFSAQAKEGEEWHEYCPPQYSHKLEIVESDEVVSTRGSLQEVYSTLTRGYFLYPRRKVVSRNTYHIVLVPVGYDSVGDYGYYTEKLNRLMFVLERAYSRVHVTFSFIDRSIPISVKRTSEGYGVLERVDDASAVFVSLNNRVRTDALLLMVNDDNMYGHYDNSFPGALFSGERKFTHYAAVHEAAHLLSLSDGYKSQYEYPEHSNKEYNIGSTELFFSIDELRPDVRLAYHELKPSFYKVGVCRSRSVYAFKDGDGVLNVMRKKISNDVLAETLAKRKPLFSDLQIMIMNNFIAQKLEDKR